jgi:hypothetical protein
MKKFFLFAAVAMMALVGCEKQNQSSLDFADVKQSAKISGTLVYVADKAGAASEEIVLANQRVYFLVAADKYADNAAGNQIFEATTKEDGSYEIVVPTGAKTINGNLKTDIIAIGEEGARIFLAETDEAIALNAGDAKVKKTVAPIDPVLTACQGTATLKGKISYNAGVVEKGSVKEDGLVAAPAGVTVRVIVKYDPADDAKDRAFVGKTTAEGTYELKLPVQAADAKNCEISIAQFNGKFTEEFNNKLLSKDAIFGLLAPVAAGLTDGEITIQDIVADRISTTDPTTKNTKIVVKGELKVAVEEPELSTVKDHEEEILKINKDGAASYTNKINNGAFQIKLVHNEGMADESSIIYDCNVESDKNGKFNQEVAIYDAWKLADVNIYIVINKFVTKDYPHYYKIAKYKNNGEWESFPGVWYVYTSKTNQVSYTDSQKCEGTYELKAGPFVADGFFDVNVGTQKATFEMSSDFKNTQLLGVNLTVDGVKLDFDADDHQIYGGGHTY